MAKADRSVAAFGAGVLLKHLNALTREIGGVRLGDNIEHLHRLRVASRRLRAALPLFSSAVAAGQAGRWGKEVRRVARASGAARDADVQIEQLESYLADLPPGPERPGIRRLILRLRQRREKLQPKVTAALDRFEASGVIETINERCKAALEAGQPDTPSARLYHVAHRAVGSKLGQFLSYEAFVPQPERSDELHAMRIAAKRLRYTVEVFAPLYPADEELKPHLSAIKEAQEYLGQIHDCDVWAEQLPAFIEKERRRSLRFFGHERPFKRLLPGLLAFQQDRQQGRQRAYERFLQCWSDWRAAGTWEQLMDAVRRPVWPERSDGAAAGADPA